jgi:GNAT superfamily N-acetyltransferase
MDIALRFARVDDAEAVARLTAQLGYEITTADAATRLSRILARRDHHFLVADVDGRLAGWLHASLSEHIDAESCVLIEGLVVDRGSRGRGIGKLLLGRAEEWATANGCSLVRLRSTAARTAAHRFYEHLGYTNIKTQYSFAKGLDQAAREKLKTLVPRVDA